MRSRALSIVLVSLLAALLQPVGGAAAASGRGVPTVWTPPVYIGWDYAYGDPGSGTTIRAGRRAFELGIGNSSAHVVRRATYQGWRSGRATITAETRACDQTCSRWRSARVVLLRPRVLRCAGGRVRTFTRYRLVGFGEVYRGETFRSAPGCP